MTTATSSAPLDQALLLRGSRQFDDLDAYRRFLAELVVRSKLLTISRVADIVHALRARGAKGSIFDPEADPDEIRDG